MNDIIQGMCYIHSSPFHSHGRLNSSNCLVDGRMLVQIADLGLWPLRRRYLAFLDPEAEEAEIRPLLWVAPEHLREPMPVNGTPKGDVYGFAIILQEIVSRLPPYHDNASDTRTVIREVRKGLNPPYRPVVESGSCNLHVLTVMQECWSEFPEERPSFELVRSRTRLLIKDFSGNLMDNLLKRMEKYSSDLEELVEERTAAFMEEKKKSEELLGQMLPKAVAEKLKRGEYIEAETFISVTICFSNVMDFAELSAKSSPLEIVNLLNGLYSLMEGIINEHDAFKVETIGESCVVVSGLPIRNGTRHAVELAKISLKIMRAMDRYHVPHRPGERLLLRFGMHTGPAAAGWPSAKVSANPNANLPCLSESFRCRGTENAALLHIRGHRQHCQPYGVEWRRCVALMLIFYPIGT
ncbi:hypothetical protein RvY_04652-2 [Ramazzottius varieornatus]|uniref:guanylate cyclase n=1 Tax=Ramazzottius varieornatus TaxID=947166 RepID=A0A1D1UVU8_RAMVA|nr:hypothetical protein RvY_04652-2 [Ramazzottius varieornatus]